MKGEAADIFRRTTDLLSQGRTSDALAMLTKAIVEHPAHAGLACRFADCLHAMERFQEARDAYGRALALDPGTFDAWYGLGCAEIACRAYGAAISSLNRATALQPTRIDAKFNLGKALFELGEIDRALDQFAVAA
ncbi:MAG TPA: tetratricopeptide repeat protein, partial [Stellaceae bacterium]|nr:tetratricopeptide repeat protein [Stellaceae bacterium]